LRLRGPHPSVFPHNGCEALLSALKYPLPSSRIVLRKPVKEPVEEREAAISEAEEEVRMCCCVCIVSSFPQLCVPFSRQRGWWERGGKEVVRMWSAVDV